MEAGRDEALQDAAVQNVIADELSTGAERLTVKRAVRCTNGIVVAVEIIRGNLPSVVFVEFDDAGNARIARPE